MGHRHAHVGLSVADLFCGAGGLSEGFASAGYDVAYGVDFDENAAETFHVNHTGAQWEAADLTKLDRADLKARLKDVDVIAGGPSCQGFSTHGTRNKSDERNKLWSRMLLAVEVGKPAAFILENVPGLEQHTDGRLHGRIVSAFEDLGYRVTTGILLAADYGVPQLRRRVFVVGLRGRSGEPFEWPVAPYLGGWRRDTLDLWEERRVAEKKYRHLSVEDAIGDLPLIPEGSAGDAERDYDNRRKVSAYAALMREGSETLRDHQIKVLSEAHRKLIVHVPPGGTWRDIPPHLRPGRFAGGMAPTDSTTLLARLHPDRPAYTITTQFDNVTGGCFTHPLQDRGLSIREAARFQSFPDRFKFQGTLVQKRRLVGNAVPPLLAQHLACAIAERVGTKEPNRPKVVLSAIDARLGVPTPETRRRMKAQARKATKPETLVAEALKQRGIAFSMNVRPDPTLRREVDILIEECRVAVFIDGCFWHGCPTHTRDTKSNTKWWRKKIDTNRARDEQTTADLTERGFHVIRIWEHEEPEDAATRIAEVVAAGGARVSDPAKVAAPQKVAPLRTTDAVSAPRAPASTAPVPLRPAGS